MNRSLFINEHKQIIHIRYSIKMHMYITIFCIICTLFLIFYKWNIVNQFSNNLVESFTATETNIKIANLQTALENIESRIT
jgi:hypothetical protein